MDVMARIGGAVGLGRTGDREGARRRLRELWEDAGVQAEPLSRWAGIDALARRCGER